VDGLNKLELTANVVSKMQGWHERNETDVPQEEEVGVPGLRLRKNARTKNEVQGTKSKVRAMKCQVHCTKCEGRDKKCEEQSTMCKIPGAKDFALRTWQFVL